MLSAQYDLATIERHAFADGPEVRGFAADVLNAAMAEVNWREISAHIITAAKEQAES